MTCIPEELALLYADRETAPPETTQVENHLQQCPRCRALLAALQQENQALAAHFAAAAQPRRQVLSRLTGSIAASVAIGVPMHALTSILGNAWTWLDHVGGFPFEILWRGARLLAPLMLLLALLPATSTALTRRTGEVVVIGAGETIQDTVFASGNKVLVEGNIEGNLFLAGRSLEIRGTVNGDVFAGGQEVRVTGAVTGNIVAAGESITLGNQVGGSLYAAGRNILIDKTSVIQRDIYTGSETVTVDGAVQRNVISAGQSAIVAGSVTRGVTFAGGELLVRPEGRIGAGISATVRDRANVRVEPGASVQGETKIRLQEVPNRFTSPRTYAWEFASLIAAFLVGWALLRFAPGFLAATAARVPSLASAGIGFLALIVTPVAAVLLCITLIGLPFGIALAFLYLAGLYLAKIVAAAYLGRELMRDPLTNLPTLLGLLLGLAILQAAFLIPFGGPILRIAVCCLGLGALFLALYHRRQAAGTR